MRQRVGLVAILLFAGLVFGFGRASAQPAPEPEHHEAAAPEGEHTAPAPEGEHHEEAPAAEHHEEAPAAEHHEVAPAVEADGDFEAPPPAVGQLDEEGEVVTDPADEDGDGVVEPEEVADNKEYQEDFAGIPPTVDEAALEKRAEDAELKPSLTAEQFRKMVGIAKKVVLGKMEKKIALKSAKRMATFSWLVFGLSCCGVFLLLMPLALKKKYPGQGAVLFKYSALAAGTFFVTVNLFGGVLFGMRTVQGALSNYTNPSIAIASGTFDTLDKNAEEYIIEGKELFAPTLEQMRANPDEQPTVILLDNGVKIIKDAKVFFAIKKMVKKVDFIFSILPIVLMGVTMLLFLLALKPTLMEIVKLPAVAASGTGGNVGRDVVAKSLRRVTGELKAAVCTLGVLVVITLVSSFVLGRVVGPAIDSLLGYFAMSVSYLQFVQGASSGLVFMALFGVILFLVLNLATLILSMGFFLGKSQKIFQQRFNEGTPISTHKKFFKWGVPSVLFVQIFPFLFVFVADFILNKINSSLLEGVTDADKVSWGKLMLAGPLMLVVAYIVTFWAARGLKAIRFLQAYKVKPVASRASARGAEPMSPT